MSAMFDSEPQEAKGFAKLDFPDGDYIITTLNLIIGRNMDLSEQWKRQRKQERHQQRAREALEQYELEPSQPSQPDDRAPNSGPTPSRSDSLEGRPDRGLPSNFSEQGGAVHYQDRSDEDQPARSRKRRRLQYSNSSTTSGPASVRPSQIDLSRLSVPPEGDVEKPPCARLPVHPARHEDIKKISHDHLLINYNLRDEHWELHVTGNRAFVNEELLPKGSVVTLNHNDEIMIPGVHMTFKLPDNSRNSPGLTPGTFSELPDSELRSSGGSLSDTSPTRRMSRPIGSVESSDDDSGDGADSEDQETSKPRKTSGIKLKIKKERKDKSAKFYSQSPEENRKASKGGKVKPTENLPKDSEQLDDASSPVGAPVFEPGSALADVPQDQLPQKRKGPGRPPKNGYVSKKDDKQVKKKMKEYETRGEEPPPYAQLVDEVRREAKLKEQQNRTGQGVSVEGGVVLQSIETDLVTPTADDETAEASGISANLNSVGVQQMDRVKKSSPKPKQRPKSKSPSPVKPLSECTEEELKKPNMTYVPLIDEAIRHSKNGFADLQEIYRTIQKLHPYFAYTAKGTGWQSSVRHNLKSERFKQVGKSGKGGFHAINHDFPLPNSEQKKGRRVTPPPRQPMPMQNGRFMPGQGPHPQYGPPQYQYGGPNGFTIGNGSQIPGNPAYRSPYSHGGAPGQVQNQSANHTPNPTHPTQQAGNRDTGSAPPSAQHQESHTPQPSTADHQYGGLVTEIMDWRINYLTPYVGSTEVYNNYEKTFKSVLEQLSAIYSLPTPEYIARRDNIPNVLRADEERRVFKELVRLFDKYHEPDTRAPNQPPKSEPESQNANGLPNNSGEVHAAVGMAVTQTDTNIANRNDKSEVVDNAPVMETANPASQSAVQDTPLTADSLPAQDMQPTQTSPPVDYPISAQNTLPAVQQGPLDIVPAAGIKRSASAELLVDENEHESKRQKPD